MVVLSNSEDSVIWAFEKTGSFTIASLYRELTFPRLTNSWLIMMIWEVKIPLKIRIFLWQVCNDGIQSTEQLVKRNMLGDINFKICGRI
jgi:hypothetical protein